MIILGFDRSACVVFDLKGRVLVSTITELQCSVRICSIIVLVVLCTWLQVSCGSPSQTYWHQSHFMPITFSLLRWVGLGVNWIDLQLVRNFLISTFALNLFYYYYFPKTELHMIVLSILKRNKFYFLDKTNTFGVRVNLIHKEWTILTVTCMYK